MISRSLRALALFCVLSAAASMATASLFAPSTRLASSDGAPDDYFGWAVALGTDTALIGADGDDNERGLDVGAAYVFSHSGGAWSQQARIVPADGTPGDAFGFAVALDGDTAVIGAPQANGLVGAAYVYVRSGAAWTLQKRLVPADPTPGLYFGFSVSVSGDTIVVGAVGDDDRGSGSGSAYVYVRSGASWTQQQKLVASDGASQDNFGWCVWVKGDTTAVAAFGDDDRGTDAGAVYVYARSVATWSQQQKLLAPDGEAYDGFSYACCLSGDTLVTSAPYDDTAGGVDSGSAHAFLRTGTTWAHQARLVPNDPSANALFGLGLAIDGDTVVSGATGAAVNGRKTGVGYVFQRTQTSWRQSSRLQEPNGLEGDELGVFAAVRGSTALLGGTQSSLSAPGLAAVFDTTATASPSIAVVTVVDENGNGAVEVNECGRLFLVLRSGGASVSGVTGVVTTLTPGVTALESPTGFGTLPALGTVSNGQPFRFFTQPGFACGAPIDFALTLMSEDGVATLPFRIPTGSATTQSFSATGPVPIPDNSDVGTEMPLTVSGVVRPIAYVTVALFIKHTYDGDLKLALRAPDGTRVVLADRLNTGGDNFGLDCPAGANDTIFDDNAVSPIASGIPPFISAYRPMESLSALAGKSGEAVNGVWALEAVDGGPDDTGAIQCWTLNITTLQCSDGGGPCEGWAGLAGDVDNDGGVTGADAVFALGVASGISNASAAVVARGDVAPSPSSGRFGYGDGRLDAQDAVRILRSVNGFETLP